MEDKDYYERYVDRTSDKINLIINNVDKFEGLRFIEVGCNTGELSKEVLKKNPKSILGIEMSENTIQEEIKKNSLFSYWAGDLINYSFDEDTDIIFCLSVLHHILGNYGWGIFEEVFNKILSFTGVLFFEIGQPEEVGNFYWKDRINERFKYDFSFLNYILSNDKIKTYKIIGKLPIHDSFRYIFKIETKKKITLK